MELKSKVRTCFMVPNKGLDVANFYVSLLPNSGIDAIYDHGQPDDPMVVEFTLAGAPMMVLTGGPTCNHTMATSISVLTQDQAETDKLWSTLINDGGEESMCGWLQDRFGISWQIVPEVLPKLLNSSDEVIAKRALNAMMKMNKIIIADLT